MEQELVSQLPTCPGARQKQRQQPCLPGTSQLISPKPFSLSAQKGTGGWAGQTGLSHWQLGKVPWHGLTGPKSQVPLSFIIPLFEGDPTSGKLPTPPQYGLNPAVTTDQGGGGGRRAKVLWPPRGQWAPHYYFIISYFKLYLAQTSFPSFSFLLYLFYPLPSFRGLVRLRERTTYPPCWYDSLLSVCSHTPPP